ncbi:unnamed protein product [Closterium sp. NIES-64]|nr:unnamed protein product [Closterium sp. NIES-64]
MLGLIPLSLEDSVWRSARVHGRAVTWPHSPVGLGLCLPSHPRLPLPTLPCVEGRQRAASHSSSFPPTTAPLQTLHMDVWGPARVQGQGRERYFLLVIDDYSRYTTVFPLRSKGEVPDVLIPWIRAVCLQLRERFDTDLPALRLHSNKGGEFSSDLMQDSCHGEGILLSFTFPASPQQNGVAERRIGLVMEVARTSRIHADAPHFLWPFAVRYAAHQLNLWPRVLVLRLGVLSLRLQSLCVQSLEVLSLSVQSVGVLSLRVWSLGVLSLWVRSLGLLSLGVLELLNLEVLLVPYLCGLAGGSLSHHSSCARGTLRAPAFGVLLLELEALLLEALALEALLLLVLEVLVILALLFPGVLMLEVLAAGAGGAAATGGAGGAEGAGAAGPGGARTGGPGADGAGGAAGARGTGATGAGGGAAAGGAGGAGAGGAARAGGPAAGGVGAGGTGAAGAGGAGGTGTAGPDGARARGS